MAWLEKIYKRLLDISDAKGPGAEVKFASTDNLASGGVYNSPVVVYGDGNYSQVQTEVLSDQDGTMLFRFYADEAGTDLIRSLTVPYSAADGYRQFGAPTFGESVRYRFTNDSGSGQGDFYFSTKLIRGAVSPQVLALDAFVSPSMLSTVQRAVLAGADTQGNFSNVLIDDDNSLNVAITSPTEAFGAILVSDLHPVVQRKWVQGIKSQADEIHDHDGGTVTAASGELVLSTSTTTSSIAQYRTRKIIGYKPGQAVVCRFTGRFTSGVAGTSQIIGCGDPEDGFFFGFNGTDFGILRRTGGQVEIRTLTVTAAASGAGNVTVTLNSVAVVTSLDGTESIAEAADKIASSNYDTAGGGWNVYSMGNQVVWLALGTESRGGSYFYVDTDATGVTGTGPAQTLAASAATDTWVAQTGWNLDPADGTATLPTLDPTLGNVFEIQFQWLGYGAILFRVEQPETGRFVNVHRIQFANAQTSPSLRQPDTPMYAEVDNGGTTSDITMQSASMAGFKAGEPTRVTDVRYSFEHSKAISTTETVVFCMRVVATAGGVSNRVRATVDELTFGNNSSNRTAQVQVVLNPRLEGSPSWASAGDDSVVEVDTAVTAFTGGRSLGRRTIGAVSGSDIPLDEPREIICEPGDVLVFSMVLASGGSSSTLVAGCGWSEST